MGAETQSARRAQFVEGIKTELPPRVDDIVVLAHRRAEVDEFIDVVHDPSLFHDLQADDRTAEGADGQAVRLGVLKNLIGRPAPAAAFDKLDNQSRITRNILA